MSIAFLLLFIAFNSADNLAAKVLRADSFSELGLYSMSALYLVFAFTGFFSAALVHSLGIKRSLFIGGLCYSLRIAAFLLPALYVSHPEMDRVKIEVAIVLSAVVNGWGSGILWVAQGKYVAECATDKSKGFFFSYFFAIFMLSQIVGNLIAAFVLRMSG